MFELTADNAADYLRQRGHLGPGPATVEVLSGGVSGLVLRVEQGGDRFVVKQARRRVRTREDWFSDLDRIHREQEVMDLLAPRLAPGSIPAVRFSERDDYVLGMEHAPLDAVPWKAALLAGEVDNARAEQAGRLL